MEQDGVISASQVANRFTLITICNWSTYQGGDEEEKPTDSPTVSQPLANCQPTVSHNLRMKECKNGRMEENGKEKASAPTALEQSPKIFTYPEDFERFWKEYPKKRAKRNAYREWMKLRPKPDIGAILAAIERLKRARIELKFTKDPERWLKGACWEDETVDGEGRLFKGDNATRESAEYAAQDIPWRDGMTLEVPDGDDG
jgi:hypothetical protein